VSRLRPTPALLASAVLLGSAACTGVAYAASFALSTNKLFAWSQTLTKGTCNQTYATLDDTYVQQSIPASTAGGTATTLSITNGTLKNIAFIRFNLAGCGLPITGGADSATLTIDVTTASGHTLSVFPVYSTWNSGTLTWNGISTLTIGTTATATFSGTSGFKAINVTTDVDAEVKAGAFWGWEITDTTNGTAITTRIASAENLTIANRPTLTFSYER
jgi:hypothetical protein